MKVRRRIWVLVAIATVSATASVAEQHHLISRHASNTEPAKLLAVFVVDTKDKALTTPDYAGGSR